MSFERTERQGIIVWVYTLRQLKNLKRIGYIHYVSDRMKYVVLYVNKDEVEKKISHLNNLHFVRRAEISPRPEIDMTFQHALPGKEKDNNNWDETGSYEEKTYSF